MYEIETRELESLARPKLPFSCFDVSEENQNKAMLRSETFTDIATAFARTIDFCQRKIPAAKNIAPSIRWDARGTTFRIDFDINTQHHSHETIVSSRVELEGTGMCGEYYFELAVLRHLQIYKT